MVSKKIIIGGASAALLTGAVQAAVSLGFMKPVFSFSYSEAIQNASLLFMIGLFLFAYLLPSFVALQRKHVNTTAICVLNILVGWSFIGWVAALIWSLVNSGDKK